MTKRRWAALGVVAVALGLLMNADRIVVRLYQFAIPTNYFEPSVAEPDAFVAITDRVYAFKHGFNRSLVVDTGDKLAVFDTFNKGHAKALAAELGARWPDKPVGWVFYSHHHLDHVRGAAALAPETVIGHRDLMSYVADFDRVSDVLPVTRTVDGDETLTIGDVVVTLLFLPRSHSETLYAFLLPDEGVLFLPDLMFKDAVPPFGFPDWYYPGYIRAIDRLLTIEAEHYVPTHFDIGARDDLQNYRNFMVDFRDALLAEFVQYDYDAANGARLRDIMKTVYPALKEKHGHRTGFDAMFIPHFGGQAGGIYLGF